jgi:5-methylcytosine-specific restriction protein A
MCVCEECRGVRRGSRVVDHIVPHRGDPDLFWNEDNWQALAKVCHDRKTAMHDGGFGKARTSLKTRD